MTTAEDVVDKAGTVQTGLDDDEETRKDDNPCYDCAPPGGIVTKLIKDGGHSWDSQEHNNILHIALV